jgi:hypothetical protein
MSICGANSGSVTHLRMKSEAAGRGSPATPGLVSADVSGADREPGSAYRGQPRAVNAAHVGELPALYRLPSRAIGSAGARGSASRPRARRSQ